MAAFRNIGLLATVFTLSLLVGCASTAPVASGDLEADQSIRAAEQLERSGAHTEAARAWLELARAADIDEPGRAAEWHLRAAEAWLRAGQAESARASLEAIDSAIEAGFSNAINPSRLNLAWAELAYMEDNITEARLRLAQAANGLAENQRLRYELLDDLVLRAETNPAREAFAELESALYSGTFTPDLALALLIDHPLASIEQLQAQNSHRLELTPWLDLVASARAVLLDQPRLNEALRAWEQRNPATGYPAEAAAAWLEAWKQTRPMAKKMMVALPGRARMQPASQALRNGIMTAWVSLRPEDRPELIFREVADQADAILSLWFEARELGVDYLIGPLERDQVDSLAALPDAGLPILLLNHPTDSDNLERMFGDILALGLIPEEEAELAAIQALVLGHKRALVIAQSSDWGQRVANAFQTTFELGGGQVMDRAEYSTAQADQSAMLEVLLNLDQSAQRAADISRVLGEDIEFEPQPRSDVDSIFLAARPDDARIVRPQLKFHRAGHLPVFGTSALIAGAPSPERDEDLDGVIIPLAPWFIDGTPFSAQRQTAEGQFNNLSNPLLSSLHALGADAFELSRWASRMAQDESLYWAGRTGRLRLPTGRRIERDLPFVQIIDGQAEALE